MDKTTKDELRQKLCSIMIEDDFPILDRADSEKLDEMIGLIASVIAASNKALLLRVREGLPEKLPHYQQETERTKREKAYFNDAITKALAVIDAEIEEL